MKTTNKYKLQDGGIIEASDAVDFVNKLREGSRMAMTDDNESFMSAYKQRTKSLYGIDLSFFNETSFLDSLIESNIVALIQL